MKKKLLALLNKHNCELYEGDNGKVDMIAPDGHEFASAQSQSIILIFPPIYGFRKPTEEDWANAYAYAQGEIKEGIYEIEEVQ
jgi:hypothetical protein